MLMLNTNEFATVTINVGAYRFANVGYLGFLTRPILTGSLDSSFNLSVLLIVLLVDALLGSERIRTSISHI